MRVENNRLDFGPAKVDADSHAERKSRMASPPQSSRIRGGPSPMPPSIFDR